MLGQILRDEWRLLTFRSPSSLMVTHRHAYLGFGLLMTWLAGVGRYWDHPDPHLWQLLGLGSIAYVLVLALLLWLMLLPLRARNARYLDVLLFLTLTAPPALLYAIPVERFMALEDAQRANVWFLGIVASWRVALWARFLLKATGLRTTTVIVAALAPLALIVSTLFVLNLEHVVFQIMGGLRPEDRTGNDQAYLVLFVLTVLSVYASPVLLVWYVGEIVRAWRR